MLARVAGFLILVAAFVLAGLGVARASEVPLQPGASERLLGNVDALVDPTGRLTAEDVAAGRGGPWRALHELPGSGAGEIAAWYRIRFQHARSDDNVYAVVWPGVVGRVDLSCDLGGSFSHASGGYDAPAKSLSEHILVIPPSDYERVCYLRALTGFYRSSPMVVTLNSALAGDTPVATTFGGFFIAIALFNLVLFLLVRDRSLLIYCGVMVVLLALLATDDAIWRFVPSTPFLRETSHAFFGWLYFAGTALFAREFLRLPKDDPVMERWVLGLALASALGLFTGLLPSQPPWLDVFTSTLVIILLVAIFIAGVRAMRRGFRAARFFVLASGGVALGVATNLLVLGLQLPGPRIVVDLFEISIGWEALMLTVALADRMNQLSKQNVELERSRAQLQVLAEHDGLTGVANRRAFDQRLREEWNRALRSGDAIGLLMIDVDHFKAYNDTLGHVAGDECLERVAKTCEASLKRGGDFFARYGGEEFAAILTTRTDEDLLVVAERMRRSIYDLGIAYPAGADGVVTISVGTARYTPQPDENPTVLVKAADAALYEAKFGGRNRVIGGIKLSETALR
ncbi:MAG: GGDEF domain-containing protein [Candidatus Eremiobacteraeota bacterium]|nr:GGDEF domain-containing protein [Candidatus Eremiobacteraeota bacterium]